MPFLRAHRARLRVVGDVYCDDAGPRTEVAKRVPSRLSVLCDGVEWVVAQGEHNAWEAMVLFLFQRAKRGGFLGSLDLRQEVYTTFKQALSTEGAASFAPAPSPIVQHGLLSILHPWSQRLEDLQLDDVSAALAA